MIILSHLVSGDPLFSGLVKTQEPQVKPQLKALGLLGWQMLLGMLVLALSTRVVAPG